MSSVYPVFQRLCVAVVTPRLYTTVYAFASSWFDLEILVAERWCDADDDDDHT